MIVILLLGILSSILNIHIENAHENVNDDNTKIQAHSQIATENDDNKSKKKDDSDIGQKYDFDSDQEECDTCDRIFENNDDLNEHQTNDNCGFECKTCRDFFRYETDLKLHQQNNCS